MDVVALVLENAIVHYTVTGEIPQRMGSDHPSIAPFDVFEARDGWFVIGVGNDTLWKKFCKIIDKEELILDPRFINNDQRCKSYDQLKPIITEWSTGETVEEALNLLVKAGVPVGEVNTIDKVINDPNIILRDMIVELNQPKAGKVKIANTPMKLSNTPAKIETNSPLLGQHTEELLCSLLSYSKEKIINLKENNII